MDIELVKSNSSIESPDLEIYAFKEIRILYTLLRKQASLHLSEYPIIQSRLIEFHSDLWKKLSIIREQNSIYSDFIKEIEDIFIDLFVFGDGELNPSIDFDVLKKLGTKLYLVGPIIKVLKDYLDILEEFVHECEPLMLESGPVESDDIVFERIDRESVEI